jgi:hypothetical protein
MTTKRKYKMTEERLIEVFREVVQLSKWQPLFDNRSPKDIEVDIYDVENFLDDYCICRGDKDEFNNAIADRIFEEFDRSISFFESEDKDATDFLIGAISEYLLNNSATLYKDWSFYSSMYDLIDMVYTTFEIDGEYFIFDFGDAPFTYDDIERNSARIDWDVVKEKVQKQINKK